MNLYILRHGLAAERVAGDSAHDVDRPLTAKGRARVQGIAAAMQALGLSFDLILSSPYRRARQTAEIVADKFKSCGKLHYSAALTPEGDLKSLLAELSRIKPAPENVLLTGHEPGLSALISTLVFGDGRGSVLLKKGGLCKVSLSSFRPGPGATLEWLLTPRQLLLLVSAR